MNHWIGSLKQIAFVSVINLGMFTLDLDSGLKFQFHLLRFCSRLKHLAHNMYLYVPLKY